LQATSKYRQNKDQSKKVFLTQPDEDDIGLKGKTCTKYYVPSKPLMFILGCISGPTVVSKKSRKRKSKIPEGGWE